jgi:CHAD domain-containing protein
MSIARKHGQLVFQKMERALLKLSSGQDAESIHGFRTTSRRLQTLLEQIVAKRDTKGDRNQKKLLKMLDRIRKRAGKVRDLDVQLAALRSLKVPQEPRRKTQLIQGLIELRAKHEKRLQKTLNKHTIREIQKRLKRGAKQVKLEAVSDPLSVARTMLAQVVRPAGPVTEDVLHQYRIVVKRARYAAEFAPKSAEAVQFMGQLARLAHADADRSQEAGRRQSIVAGGGPSQRDGREIPSGSRCAFGLVDDSSQNDPDCAERCAGSRGTTAQTEHEISRAGGAD